MMSEILKTDDVRVTSEVVVCETLMQWLRVQTEAGNVVHPEELLVLVRWSGIGIDYIKETLLRNEILINDTACLTFLSKVISFLMAGVQFKGLRTFHRPSTEIANFLILLGFRDDQGMSRDVCRVNLSHPEVTSLNSMPTSIGSESAACTFNDSLYVTGVGDAPFKELWKWDVLSGWIRCADLDIGRRRHVLSVVDSKLHAIGGWATDARAIVKSIESYNTKTNKWLPSGELIHAVSNAACVSYKNLIYIFGGQTIDNQAACHVQEYNTAQESCAVLDQPMPRAYYLMQAVLWESSAILLGRYTCFLYDFDTETWQERRHFKTNVVHFGSVLDNGAVYIAGGGIDKKDENNKWTWSYTDEVKCVDVVDVMENRPAVWKQHSKLPSRALMGAYSAMSLPKMDVF